MTRILVGFTAMFLLGVLVGYGLGARGTNLAEAETERILAEYNMTLNDLNQCRLAAQYRQPPVVKVWVRGRRSGWMADSLIEFKGWARGPQ